MSGCKYNTTCHTMYINPDIHQSYIPPSHLLETITYGPRHTYIKSFIDRFLPGISTVQDSTMDHQQPGSQRQPASESKQSFITISQVPSQSLTPHPPTHFVWLDKLAVSETATEWTRIFATRRRRTWHDPPPSIPRERPERKITA